MSKIVTRYAPSPTGNPHVGNIRTALFNYLWAKHNGGKFLLRIEDTDRARFVPEAVEYIEESLKWLGIKYDGEKVYQSDRLPVYQKSAEELVGKGLAYKCFCSPKRLEELRKDQEKRGLPPAYDKKCRDLSKTEVAELEKKGEAMVFRFAMPETGKAVWDDLVRGKVEIEYATQDDFVIIKSDGWPTYNFANVIDDYEMEVTDVIRGEEFIPSTPKHLMIYKAFGWKAPNFGHLPLIVGPDKKKLSKRHGDTAILDYAKKGYLPETMVNFLALLGWNPGTTEEFFTMEELVKRFDIKRVQSAPAVFDLEKLNWFNGNYIRKIPSDKLKMSIENLMPNDPITKLPNFDRILEVEKTRLVTLADITKGTNYFVKLPKYDPKLLVFKKSTKEATERGLKSALEALEGISDKDWEKRSVESFENVLKKVVEDNGLSNGDVFWPVRVALSGLEKSPSPAELLWVFGKEESLKRIKNAIVLLK